MTPEGNHPRYSLRIKLFPGQGTSTAGRLSCTEVGAESPGQALTLLSEDGPNFISRALSETLPRSLGVQDFLRQPPYYLSAVVIPLRQLDPFSCKTFGAPYGLLLLTVPGTSSDRF